MASAPFPPSAIRHPPFTSIRVEVSTVCLASIVMTEAQAIPAIVSFATAPAEMSLSKPPPDRVLDGDPHHTARNYFSDSTGQLFSGVWESTPGRWRVTYTENEFCHITAGKVVIESVDGNRSSFGAGDSFVIPAGFIGVWHVLEPLRKLYVIFEPASR
jgi:uncharacterized protein